MALAAYDGYHRGYVSFAHFLLYLSGFQQTFFESETYVIILLLKAFHKTAAMQYINKKSVYFVLKTIRGMKMKLGIHA